MDTAAMNDESNAKNVFLRLDPVVRMLIASIERYRQCIDEGEDTEYSMGLLRTQVKLMERLQEEIRNIPCRGKDLAAMADYLTLPLALLLRNNHTTWDATSSLPTNTLTDNARAVWQSAHWKTVQAAADTMRVFVESCGGSLSSNQTLKFVASCAMALPTQHPAMILEGQLDRGEACVEAILKCIDSLLPFEMPVALFAKIVRGCLLSLGRASDEASQSSTGGFFQSSTLQLQALKTLRTLFKSSSDAVTWPNYLPGCFGTLYRLFVSQLRPSATQASPQVAAESIDTLSLLLSVAMKQAGQTAENDQDRNNAGAMLLQIQSLSAVKTKEKVQTEESQCDDDDDFRKEVNEKLPVPLTILLNFLTTARSRIVRLSAPKLCRVLLRDIRHVWDMSSSPATGLLQVALECCLVLSLDKDEGVKQAARLTLEECQSAIGNDASVIGPRIMNLLQEVSVLSNSQQEVELRAKLRLLCAYFDLGASTDSLGQSLVEGAGSEEIRTILIGMFDMDFESVQYSPTDALLVVDANAEPGLNYQGGYRCRFVSEETEADARSMVRALGACIGSKRACSFVDLLIAELFQAAVDRIEAGCSLYTASHAQWLHEWVGSLVIALDVINGAFGNGSSLNIDDRETRKARKRLVALCRAILPIITSAPLWTLPTTTENIDGADNSDDGAPVKSVVGLLEVGDGRKQHFIDHGAKEGHAVSAMALRGNTVVVSLLIQMVTTMVLLLRKEAESFLSILMYPLCEKTGSKNHSQVQSAASQALYNVAVAVGTGSAGKLLQLNFDYLFGSVLSRLRLPGGRTSVAHTGAIGYPFDVASVMLAILRTSACADKSNLAQKRTLMDETNVSYIIQAVTLLISRYDTVFAGTNSGDEFVSASLELVQTLHAVAEYVASSLERSIEESGDTADAPSKDEIAQPWWDLLRPFLLDNADGLEDDGLGDLKPKEGFKKMRELCHQDDEDTSAGVEISTGELDFFDLMIRRCGFMLSLSSLKVQVASCEAMERAFRFLGFLALHYKERDDETNGPKTAVLRLIADVWPAVLGRLQATTSSLAYGTRTKAVSLQIQPSSSLAQSHSTADTSTQTIFASKLFILIGTMVEESDDFMAGDRLKLDVWPILKKVLGYYLQERDRLTALPAIGTPISQPDSVVYTEKERLLWNVLDFIRRVYRQHDCGSRLAELIPETGTLLLTFLSDPFHTGDKAMAAMQAMLEIDPDSQLRALTITSGRRLPSKPFARNDDERHFGSVPSSVSSPASTLQRRAAELLNFIVSRPEQPLEE